MPTDAAYAAALVFAAWVALDLGRRWIAYRAAQAHERGELDAFGKRITTTETAFAALAKQLASELDAERKRIQRLEDRRTAETVSRSAAGSTKWRGEGLP